MRGCKPAPPGSGAEVRHRNGVGNGPPTASPALRKACTEEGVGILWGLEIMTALVRANAMSAADAIQTAEKVHLSNPLHIPRKLVDRFTKIVTDVEKKRSGK